MEGHGLGVNGRCNGVQPVWQLDTGNLHCSESDRQQQAAGPSPPQVTARWGRLHQIYLECGEVCLHAFSVDDI
jgi:hypothetical protein